MYILILRLILARRKANERKWVCVGRNPTAIPSSLSPPSPLENLKLFRFYDTITNFMRWAPYIYLHFHKNLIIPQHSAQLMYFFALLESCYCERRQFSKEDALSLSHSRTLSLPRRNKNYTLGWHNILDAFDADWQKRWRIMAFDAVSRQIGLNRHQITINCADVLFCPPEIDPKD